MEGKRRKSLRKGSTKERKTLEERDEKGKRKEAEEMINWDLK